MGLWIVDYVPGARGCPVVLKGTLNQPWAWDEFDPSPPGEVPSGYVYTARHRVLDFDHWEANRLASQAFVEICHGIDLRVHPVPVEVLQSGARPTAKRYSYLLWSEWASVIDLDLSEYEIDTDLTTGQPLHHRYFPEAPVLESVERFIVDESKIPAAAAFRCLDLDHRVVCDDAFKRACEDAGLAGMGFTDITAYTKADFWG